MPMTLKQIKGRDRWNVAYVTGRVHGLAFDDDPTEEAKPYTCFEQDVQDLYDKYKTEDQPLVAYKGGQAVKDTLKKLGKPLIGDVRKFNRCSTRTQNHSKKIADITKEATVPQSNATRLDNG